MPKAKKKIIITADLSVDMSTDFSYVIYPD